MKVFLSGIGDDQSSETIFHLFHRMASYQTEMGRYKEALPLPQTGAKIALNFSDAEFQDSDGNHCALHIELLNLISIILAKLNRYKESEEIFLDIRKRGLVAGDPQYGLREANTMAIILLNQNRYVEAEQMIKESLEKYKSVCGAESNIVLVCLNTLACALQDQGKLEQAEKLWTEVLEIRKTKWGEFDRGTVKDMQNLVGICLALGRNEKAEGLWKRIIEIQKKVVGDDHHHETFAPKLSLASNICCSRPMERSERPCEWRFGQLSER
jgi:tetratricopeptide (TPR) repeat protein